MAVNTKRSTGFTLTEMLIVLAILAILMGLGAPLMAEVTRYFTLTKARADLQREARGIMYVLTRELRQAQSGSIVVGAGAVGQPYYSQITFTKQQGKTMTFYQNGNELVQSFNGHTEVLAKDLRYLAFTFPRTDDLSLISVSMTLQDQIYQGQYKALHMASQQVRIMN